MSNVPSVSFVMQFISDGASTTLTMDMNSNPVLLDSAAPGQGQLIRVIDPKDISGFLDLACGTFVAPSPSSVTLTSLSKGIAVFAFDVAPGAGPCQISGLALFGQSVATGDGSPTSGGSGDVIVTEDTYTDTGTGTSGQKLAGGKLYAGSQGTSLGPIVPIKNDLPTNDFRATALLGLIAELLSDIRDAEQGILGNQSVASQIAIQAQTTTVSDVVGSATSVQLLGPNAARIGATFYNDSTSTGNLYLLCVPSNAPNLKATTARGGCTVRLPPGGTYDLPANAVHIGFIVGLWDSVTVPGWVNITEYS